MLTVAYFSILSEHSLVELTYHRSVLEIRLINKPLVEDVTFIIENKALP